MGLIGLSGSILGCGETKIQVLNQAIDIWWGPGCRFLPQVLDAFGRGEGKRRLWFVVVDGVEREVHGKPSNLRFGPDVKTVQYDVEDELRASPF